MNTAPGAPVVLHGIIIGSDIETSRKAKVSDLLHQHPDGAPPFDAGTSAAQYKSEQSLEQAQAIRDDLPA